jgi:hypothetical protein
MVNYLDVQEIHRLLSIELWGLLIDVHAVVLLMFEALRSSVIRFIWGKRFHILPEQELRKVAATPGRD